MTELPETALPETRARFPQFLTIPTRWMDNDLYGHVNNAHALPEKPSFSKARE